MGFPISMEVFFQLWIQFIAVLFQGTFCHFHATIKIDNPFQGRICLQAHNYLIFPVNISRCKIVNTGYDIGFHIQNAFFHFFQNQFMAFIPYFLCSICNPFQESVITFVKGIVFLNKVSDINFFCPFSCLKTLPSHCIHFCVILSNHMLCNHFRQQILKILYFFLFHRRNAFQRIRNA